MHIQLYTDGAARGNPGRGGYGVVLIYGNHRRELSGGFLHTTNNRMELLAVIEGLKAIKNRDIPVTIYSDSKYVVDAIEKGWLKNWLRTDFKGGKKNKDLWLEFAKVAKPFKLTLKWVKGHAENEHNNRCDELATAAADGRDLIPDEGYGNGS